MIELTDEILNRFIDDELNPSEKKEVNKIIKSSEDARRRLYAMKLVHTELKKYPPAKPSLDFTSVLMKKIIRRQEPKGQRYFIFSISSVFIIISLAIIGYLTSFILSIGNSTDEGNGTVNNFVQLVEKLVNVIQTLFSNGNVSIIGFIFSFAIIISAYFFFDSHKQARAKLTKL